VKGAPQMTIIAFIAAVAIVTIVHQIPRRWA
jgi:hypothetical protein